MSQSSDYVGGMSHTRFRDDEIESLLTRESIGSEELQGLEEFIAAFATGATQPRETYHMGTTLAAISRATAPTARRGVRRLATLAATGAIFAALSGVALAADGSVPGDPLYRLDRALEAIGIGDGGFEERVEEFNVLLDRGEEEVAYEFMAEVLAEAGSEAAHQPNAGPANESPAPATGNRPEGDPGESRSGNNRSQAPGQDNSQSPGNGNAPFGPADEAPPSNSNNQGRGVGPDGETPNPGPGNNSGQGNTNPGQDNPGQNNPGQGNENPGPANNSGQGTENPSQDNPGQDNPGQGNANPGGGSAGQGQPGSNPPTPAGQGSGQPASPGN